MSNFMTVIGALTLFDDMDISESTKQEYLARLSQFAGFLHRNGINRNSLLEYKKYLRSRIDLGTAAKNKYLAVARITLKELYRRGAISIDLSLGVKSFEQSLQHKVEGLTEQEAEMVCHYLCEQSESFKILRLRALVALLLYQGLRQIEIVRLDIGDVDLATGRLQVLGKSRDSKQYIYLHPESIKALRAYLHSTQVRDEAQPLFVSQWGKTKGSRLTTRGLRYVVKGLLEQLNIGKTVHGFRHTFVTTLVKSYKSDLLRVTRYSRHRSTDMLMIYDDAVTDKQDLEKYYASFSYSLSV